MRKKDVLNNPPIVQEEKKETSYKIKKKNLSNEDIAKTLGVHYGTVCRWFREYDANDMQAIRMQRRGRRFGEQRTLSLEQEKEIRKILTKKLPIVLV